MKTRGKRKTETGVVTSDKMDKTITVSVAHLIKHEMYKKYIRRYVKYKAHDENNDAKMGDRVEIMETRPLSKTKRWRLVRILEKSKE